MHIFDTYNLRARICVSIFYASPLVVDVIYLMGKTLSVTESILVSALCIAICQSLVCMHHNPTNRHPVKNKAAELLLPTSTLLPEIRARYYRKLAKFEPEFQRLLEYNNSSSDVLKENHEDVFNICISVISWLRANTRNKETFPLVYEENINYGFKKNMMRLKPIGITINIIAILMFGTYIYTIISSNIFTWSTHCMYCFCLLLHIASTSYLCKCINDSGVDDAATRYANALLETIDIL